MATIKHLEAKYCIISYEMIKVCDADELRFYAWLKLWAINSHEAFPSYTTIQEDLGMSRMSVARLIKKMEKSGRLKVKRSNRRNNIYDITRYDELVTKRYSTSTKSELKLVTNMDSNKEKETNRNITMGREPRNAAGSTSLRKRIEERIEKPQKIYSSAHLLAVEISEWAHGKIGIPMAMRLVKTKGERFVRGCWDEVRKGNSREPVKLFMWKIGQTKVETKPL